MLGSLGHRLHDLPSRVAERAVALPPVARWREGRYATRLASHRSAEPTGLTRTIAGELERTGIVQRPLSALGLAGAAGLLRAGQQAIAANRAALEARAMREDFVTLPSDELVRRPEIFRFGLQDRLLDIVEAYLGQPVAYDGVAIHFTRADGREAATRLWHRDREDRRMVKLAIYLNAVDEDGGPFELLPIPAPEGGADPFHLTAAEQAALAARHPSARVVRCTGAAGTAIFADTARFFHRGRPATGRDRGALFFSYFAARPKHPFFCDRSGLARPQVRTLVGGLGPRQREAALWRERLPLGWRLIPSARV